MTALKKTVRTRRGVEPTGRPARREVEQGRRATNELVQDVRAESWSAALAGCAAGRRPPAGSAARARPGRARGPWGRQSYGIPSRWRRRRPVNARRAAGDKMPLLLNKPHRNAPRATERFLAESSFRFVAASASRDAAKRARDVASRSSPVVRARDGPHRDFLEDVGGGGGGASSTRGESPARGEVGPSRPRRRKSRP